MMNKNYPKIFVIILNFNGGSLLLSCLKHVFQSNYPNFEVVVVDNNSTDHSFEKARLQFAKAHFIKNSHNLGFAKGNNLGIRFALEKFADYVLVLNNDALIKKDTLTELWKIAEGSPTTGIISPLINKKDNIWFAGGKINWRRMKAIHLTTALTEKPYPTEFISGCSMLIKQQVFEKIGLFDERYFLYYEDVDFSVRANKSGFGLLVAPEIQINHFEKSDFNVKKIYWLVLSGLIFFKTHSNFWQKIYLFFYIKLRQLKNVIDSKILKKKIALEVTRAYRDFKVSK